MSERGYQANFYTLNTKLRDRAIRQRKAEKIAWALTNHAGRSLDDAVALDVGCSSGVMTAVLAPLFAATIGLEYDETALATVEPELRSRIAFLRGDAMRLPLPDASVDVIICAQVYEHVPDDARLFAEMHRVLRPGGVVFFSGPNWLFPIEPHYYLPFLHWLPPRWANAYLRVLGMGDEFYERFRTEWGLRHLMAAFVVDDISRAVLEDQLLVNRPGLRRLVSKIPAWLWQLLVPINPNFNWILHKPASPRDPAGNN